MPIIRLNYLAGLFAGHDPTRSGHAVFKISRVGSGRVKRCSNLVDRVKLGQQFVKSHGSGRVGSGQYFFQYRGSDEVGSNGGEKLTGRVRSCPANCFLQTRGSDPCIRLADPTPMTLPSLSPKGLSRTIILKNMPLVKYSKLKHRQINPNTHARIYPYPLQPG